MSIKNNLLATAAVIAAFSGSAFAAEDEGPLDAAAAYVDTLRPGGTRPGIWAGSPNVTFVGTSEPYDSGAIKLHNRNYFPVRVTKVTVDFGDDMQGVNIWLENSHPSSSQANSSSSLRRCSGTSTPATCPREKGAARKTTSGR